jgi:hypothetical protein
MTMTRTILLGLAAICLTSCGDGGGGGREPTVSIFDPASPDFFDVPFPNELRRHDDGTIDLAGFPNPRNDPWVRGLIEAAEENEGFGTASAVYFRFSAPIDTTTLPATPQMSRSLASSVFLVDLDEDSPGYGEPLPVYTFFRETEGFGWKPDTLVLLPAQGFVLRELTLYAAVVTEELRDRDGRAVARDEGFSSLVDGRPDDGPSYSDMETLYRDGLGRLGELGVEPDAVAGMTLFRTLDPTAGMRRVAEVVYDEVETPSVADVAMTQETDQMWVFEGHYGPNPIYQYGWDQGLFPYEDEGGGFVFDENGDPQRFGDETLAFALSVPKTPMPVPGGFPVLIYAHGTGGDYLSFVRDGTAGKMAELGIAALGIDNAMNGTRIPEGSSADLLFFNVMNIRAGRDNNRQAAVDVLQLEKLVPVLVIAAADAPGGEEIRLDPGNILFMGHSQGGLNGALYLALSRACRGAYLSGSAGNMLYTIVYKKSPVNIMATIGLMLGLTATELETFDIGIFHPMVNLVQMFIDPADPVNYGRHWFAEPFDGIPPKSILQVEGMGDTYAPPQGIEALGVAAGLVPVNPMLATVEGFELMGTVPVDRPVVKNVSAGIDRVTAGFAQYAPAAGEDGHFVSFDNEDAIDTWTWFLYTMADSNEPEIR